MVKTKFKKAVSLMLAAVMSLTAFTGIGATTAFAAVGEKADVYLVDYPRSGDTNNNGEWGHGNLNYMNGWKGLSTKYTGLRAMGSYSGNIAYCIEPGTGQRTGDTLTEKDENFFNNISPNGTISGDDIRLLIGRILQYGYRGGISTSWKSQNESDANCIAHAYATQILIWETIVGERDAGFNHVSTSGYNAVLECVSTAHPLRSKILSYYNSMVTSVQNHTKVPSFCTRSSGSAKVNELEWNGSKYVATLTDTNGVLGNYNFSANIDGVSFSVSGNKLTVSMEKAPSKEFTITAAKKNGVRRGVVVWSDGIHQNGNGIQDVVTYAQEVSDPVSGFVKMKVSYGSCQIVKTSEDGKVDGIQFTISGNGVNQTVTTANGGKFQLDNLMPGVYTVTEQSIDKYVPQEVHRVTVVAGQVSKVNFNNVLKRGNLQVIKSSEDNLVEGVTFHLYGTSLSGIAVDEYAVTDKNGVASFDDVLISGTTPYTIEEVDTAIRYVVPANQTAPINWKEVTTRNFTNILKKFSVTVTKSDREEGTPQGDATLAGAVYGIYKGETLVDKYVTDKNGQFTTKEYVCDNDWTIREITPSEGYLLDTTVHKVGAEPQLYTVEHNQTANDVTEQVMKGNIAIIKHTDDGETQIETPENGATFEIYLKSSGSFDAAEEDERDVIVCDENGFGQTKDMPYGVYTVHQTSGSPSHINAMDMNKEYGDGANPVILKSEFIMSLCEQLIGGTNLGAKQKSIIDRCTASVYRDYQQRGYTGTVPTLQDFRAELLKQDEPEAKEIALAIELFTHGSLNTFAKPTNVDTDNRLICYDILDLGKQLMPIGMLVVLDSILNRITQNRAKGKQTFIFIDEIYLLFQHEYSANFLFTLWKRVRKYGAYATGITQNVDDLLQSHTARTMLANSEFLIMLNQASTDRIELAKLLNISDLQLSYITNVDAGHGLIKVGSSLVPFANKFPKNTKLYKLMTTKPGEGA